MVLGFNDDDSDSDVFIVYAVVILFSVRERFRRNAPYRRGKDNPLPDSSHQ